MSDACIVRTTVATEADAERIAHGAVEQRLAACVQSLPIRSEYRWQGKVEDEPEILLLAKTLRVRAPALVAWIRDNHPYDVPEIIVTPIEDGHPPYLEWIEAETRP